MADSTKSTTVFRFGVFEVDAATGELRKKGLRVRLQDQPSQLLLLLLDRPGEVVSREEICRTLWSPGTFVDFDQSLATALRKLRQALGDDADTPRYIETIPKNGFRFIAPIETLPEKTPIATNDAPDGLQKPSIPSPNNVPPKTRSVPRTRWLLLTALCMLSFLAGWVAHTHPAASDDNVEHVLRPVRSVIRPPANWSFEHSSFALSPDGSQLAFVAVGTNGADKLWIRALSASNAQPIEGTDGALMPFWAPDSHRIGFFASGKLSTVDLNSGAVRTISEAPFGRCGGSWGREGTIVFSPFVGGPLYRVPDTGGVPVAVTRTPNENDGQGHMWPFFLPDGRHFFYSDSRGRSPQGESVYVGSLDGGAPKLISSEIAGNVAYASGYLVFSRDHTLWAQPFDLRRLELTGTARSVTGQELDEERSFSHAEFSISRNGALVFRSTSDSAAALTWFDAAGRELGRIGESTYLDPRLSPDGRFLAVSSDDSRNGKFFIRVYDLARGVSVRLTDGGYDTSPAWTSDGRAIAYRTLDALKEVAADGASPPQLLLKGGTYLGHMDWLPDSHFVFTDFSGGSPSLKIYSASDHQLASFTIGAEARFSPDGKWIAYVGPLRTPDTDGIFIAPYPGPGEGIRVSGLSGAQPNWAADGRHVFYISPDRKLMTVDFDPKTKSAGAPRVLFQTRIIAPNFSETQYAVSYDGRFLINSFPSSLSAPLTLITGWTAH